MQSLERLFRKASSAFLAACAVILLIPQSASAVLIDFEGLADFELITNQYQAQGVTFSGALAAVAFPDGTLNEIDFPPTSGITALTNESGAVNLQFGASGVGSLGGNWIYSDLGLSGQPLTLSAFSPTDTVNPLSTLVLNENLGSPSALGFSGIGPIGSVVVTPAQGGFFTLDDLSFEPAGTQPGGGPVVPEPSSFVLLGGGLAAMLTRKRRRRS